MGAGRRAMASGRLRTDEMLLVAVTCAIHLRSGSVSAAANLNGDERRSCGNQTE